LLGVSDRNQGDVRGIPLSQRVAQVRYDANWQGTAVRMQYERVAAHLELPPEEQLAAHMRAVVDMDFLITAVRRLLRVAQRARRLGVDSSGELREAVKAIAPQAAQVVRVRNALEHLDQQGVGIVPVAGGGSMSFASVGGPIDVHELFKAAEDLCKGICRVIERAEQE
jgi:hypothetical protein